MRAKSTKTKRKKRAAAPVKFGTRAVRTTRKTRAAMLFELGTEVNLEQLRESTQKTFESLHSVHENDIPQERRQEYWRDHHFARTAWEAAENAAFADLIEEQKRRLPSVAASNAKLAKDVQTTADALAMLELVSTSLSILAEVITLLSRAIPK